MEIQVKQSFAEKKAYSCHETFHIFSLVPKYKSEFGTGNVG